MSEEGAGAERCPWCGHRGPLVAVHAHRQCARCGVNVEPCCTGAQAADEAGAAPNVSADASPRMFVQLFEHLGGLRATVTTDALLFAITQHLGTDLDDARIVLEAGERVGIVQRAAPGAHRLRAKV